LLTHPDLAAADLVALHARGVRWGRVIGVWDAAGLTAASIGLGLVDEVWSTGAAREDLFRPVRASATFVAA
jgi:hypothetical protein